MTEELRWVVDTNVLISRLLAAGSVPAQALDLAHARGALRVPEATLQALADALGRPKFDPYVSRADRVEFIQRLSGACRIAPALLKLSACRDGGIFA